MSLRSLLDRYDRATERWAKINEEAEADGMPPSVKDCERYSAELEALAHEFAAFAWDQTYLLDAVQVEALKRVLGNAWQVWGDTEAFLVYRELVLRPRNAMGGNDG